MSEYAAVHKSTLKLKGVAAEGKIKKFVRAQHVGKQKGKKTLYISRKSKKAKKEKDESTVSSKTSVPSESVAGDEGDAFYRNKTKAEIAFLKKKELHDAERIRKKALGSHKERVSKFNQYLDNLSEHYEQSKVSWTK